MKASAGRLAVLLQLAVFISLQSVPGAVRELPNTPNSLPKDFGVVVHAEQFIPADSLTLAAADTPHAVREAAQAVMAVNDLAPPADYAVSLNSHNAARARHSLTTMMIWDTTVAASAAAYAAKCIWGHDPSNTLQGENLYAASYYNDPTQQQSDGVTAWYNEIAQYNYANPGFAEATGHFTQLVWKKSTKLGCAYANCPSGMTNFPQGRYLLVCRYFPPGNVAGYYQTQVMPLVSNNPQPSTSFSPSPSPSPKPSPSPSPSPTPVKALVLAAGINWSNTTSKASPSGIYKLYMQSNGKLELKRTDLTTPIWSSSSTASTTGSSSFKATVATTGQLTITTSTGTVVWTSNQANPVGMVAPYSLRIQDDGNVRLVDSKRALVWQTNTAGM